MIGFFAEYYDYARVKIQNNLEYYPYIPFKVQNKNIAGILPYWTFRTLYVCNPLK